MNGAARTKRFVHLRAAQRVWAIAAIHAEARRLPMVHDRISERFLDGDRVVYLGNYIGHGEAVGATIGEMLDFLGRQHGFSCDVAFLRGAQEEMWQKLLQLQFAPNPVEVLAWMAEAGRPRHWPEGTFAPAALLRAPVPIDSG